MSHTYTKEIIFHYTCSKCKNWWSYATTDGYNPVVAYCPHCSTKDSPAPADPGQTAQRMVKLTSQRVACGD